MPTLTAKGSAISHVQAVLPVFGVGLAGTFRNVRELATVTKCACQPHPKHLT